MIQTQLIGNLGADPECRVLEDGRALTTFPVAVTMRRGGYDVTEWVTVVTSGTLGDNCARYLAKGRKVFVQGTPKPYGYRNRLEEITARLEVSARIVEFLSSKSEDQPPSAQATESAAATPPGFVQADEVELPF